MNLGDGKEVGRGQPSPNSTAPSAPIAEEEDIGGTTPYTPTPQDCSPNRSALHLLPDTTDSPSYTYGPSAPDLPPYSEDLAPPPKQSGGERNPLVTLPKVGEVRVGVNLVRAARRLLSFLAQVDAQPALYRGPLVTQALRR